MRGKVVVLRQASRRTGKKREEERRSQKDSKRQKKSREGTSVIKRDREKEGGRGRHRNSKLGCIQGAEGRFWKEKKSVKNKVTR